MSTSARIQVPQSESKSPRRADGPLTGNPPPDLLPITSEDFVELRVESQLIPFITSATSRVEQASNGPPPLSRTEAVNLIEILDKVFPTA